MVSKKTAVQRSLLSPLHSILFVCGKGITEIYPEAVRIELVGEKAFGLSCLPKAWTLPFVAVSGNLLLLYKKSRKASGEQLIKHWSKQIISAALSVGIQEDDTIIVRSSGCSEGLGERGRFHSEEGAFKNLSQPLTVCLKSLASDISLNKQEIPLVIQKYVIPISAKGHLSNERRCYEEKRDWLGEFEDIKMKKSFPFQINLRNWRKKIAIGKLTEEALACNLSAHVSELLRIPATWGSDQEPRLHFEWVWDGRNIYLVQVDQEREINGVDPTEVHQPRSKVSITFAPKCLKKISRQHAIKYNKIRSVFTYLKLGLPITTLYVLDDQSVINGLAEGKVLEALEEDIRELVKGSLVIRMDIATEDAEMRQLLPRTQEVRKLDKALEWLERKSSEIKKKGIKEQLVFIFHNFVPAAASAFAYAAPGERKVQIEALWGLPEGLYYNAHDKYIVDTINREITKVNRDATDRFVISEKRNFKHFFVAPDRNGMWTMKTLKPPYDWRGTIQKKKWIKEMAFESRRIAEEAGNGLSIMWFVDVVSESCERKILPWHHEPYVAQKANRVVTHHTKTPFDKSLIIKTSDDIEELRKEAEKARSSVRCIRIQPCEDKLLRDKDTLRIIGKLSRKIDAIILLEGGILSHAYYQLMKTSAIVEVLHPFRTSEGKREFNKLVRDKVSSNIEHNGEVVNKTQLSGESLLRALREKLVEEVVEALDAVDQDSIISELADASEIIDGILSHIGANRDDLLQRQKQKREKSGGFKKGIVLLETRNPLPTKKGTDTSGTLFDNLSSGETREYSSVDERAIIELGHAIDKHTDKREHQASTEVILRLLIPMVRDNWSAETPKTVLDSDLGTRVRARITGKRVGSKLQIELSIFAKEKQLDLFRPENPKKGKAESSAL